MIGHIVDSGFLLFHLIGSRSVWNLALPSEELSAKICGGSFGWLFRRVRKGRKTGLSTSLSVFATDQVVVLPNIVLGHHCPLGNLMMRRCRPVLLAGIVPCSTLCADRLFGRVERLGKRQHSQRQQKQQQEERRWGRRNGILVLSGFLGFPWFVTMIR